VCGPLSVASGCVGVCCLCWDRRKPWIRENRGCLISPLCPDSRCPARLRLRAGFARPHRNSGPPPLLPPGCPPAATHAYYMNLRSLSSSPAVWPSCPASARARSPRAGACVRPAVHALLRQVKIRAPPSSSPLSYLFPPLPPTSCPDSKP
jgi:hypothetical protein